MKKFLAAVFLVAWVAGEAPRLWWGKALPVRPMDAAAGLLAVADMMGGIRRIRGIGGREAILLIIAAAILGPYAVRTLVYGWLIWRGKEIFGGVRKWIMPAMASFLILGLGQYVFFPDMRFLLQYGWDEHYYRLVGTVLDPNYFGVMAGMIGLFAIQSANLDSVFSIRSARNPRSLRRRFPVGIKDRVLTSSSSMISKTPSSILLLVLLSFIGLVLTFSRASWLAVLVAGGWWLVVAGGSGRLRRLGILGILGILGVSVWWAAPKPGGEGVNLLRTASIDQRLVSWNQAIGVWKQHPWVGVGFKGYGSELPSSSWLVILEMMGVVGVMVIGSLVISYWRRLDNFWKAMAVMVGIHAIFNNTLFYPPVLGLLALLKCKYQILTLTAAK